MTIIVLLVAVLALLAASYLDVNSTLQFLNRGSGTEVGFLGLFGAMAWLQRTFPTTWPYIKVGVTLMLAGLAIWAFPLVYAVAGIVFFALLFLIEALSNYQLSK